MGMGEDKVILEAFFIDQMVAESSNSGSGIDDNDIITFGPDFDAGGITAVFVILLA
jgi:hypothetical protein